MQARKMYTVQLMEQDMTDQIDPEKIAAIKALLKSHRVYFVVGWELPKEQFGSTEYITDNPEQAERFVKERINSGLPVTYQFVHDEHDFGEDRVASISTNMHWEPSASDVLRMVADQLDEEAELTD